MKKFLLASTALVGAFSLIDQAGAQQLTTDSPFTVRIDGFMNFRGGFVSESNKTSVAAPFGNALRNAAAQTNGRADAFRTDTEIHITATGKADNGLVYGMYVEIEADPALNTLTTASTNIGGGSGVTTQTTIATSGQNYIDEANIFLQGSWGRVELGDQDGAGDQLFFGAPYDWGPAYGDGSGADGDLLFRWANGVGITNPTSNITGTPLYSWNLKALDSGDSTKITYLSPVISGFRAGISFVPDGAQNGFLPTNAGGTGGRSQTTINSITPIPALPASGSVAGIAKNLGAFADYQHWIELGMQWRGTIGDFGLGANFEYTHAEHKKGLFNPQALTAASAALGQNGATQQFGAGSAAGTGPFNYVEINSWAIGVQASWMGITFGGSYSNHGRSTLLSGPGLTRGQDAYAYALGLQYAIGPWVVGMNYSFSLDAGSTAPTAQANGRTAGAGSDINEWITVGAKYILAPGLFLFGEYGHYNIQSEGFTVNVGDAGVLGVGVRF
jgi:hypothetical protein